MRKVWFEPLGEGLSCLRSIYTMLGTLTKNAAKAANSFPIICSSRFNLCWQIVVQLTRKNSGGGLYFRWMFYRNYRAL